jgi:hypothetical protein
LGDQLAIGKTWSSNQDGLQKIKQLRMEKWFIPKTPKKLLPCFRVVDDLVQIIDIYHLACRLDVDPAALT